MTEDKAVDYLVELSSVSPEKRVAMTRGDARAIFVAEADFVQEGWPAAYLNGWRHQAWIALELAPEDDATLLRLRHGNTYGDWLTRFQMVCDQGDWFASRLGSELKWYDAPPQQLAGQDGPLTEELANRMIQELEAAMAEETEAGAGLHRSRLLTTGKERERLRSYAVFMAAAPSPGPAIWHSSTSLKLVPEGANRVIAEGYDEAGNPSGVRVLFERVDGRWLIADHGQQGKWAEAYWPEYAAPAPLWAETSLMGVSPGDSIDSISHLLPSTVNGGQPSRLLTARGLAFAFTPRVSSIEVYAGSTQRGLLVGDPSTAALTLYGEPTDRTPDAWVYKDAGTVLEIGLAKDDQGVERVHYLRLSQADAN